MLNSVIFSEQPQDPILSSLLLDFARRYSDSEVV